MGKDDPTTRATEAGPQGADDDVETDPAKDTERGSDWSDERHTCGSEHGHRRIALERAEKG